VNRAIVALATLALLVPACTRGDGARQTTATSTAPVATSSTTSFVDDEGTRRFRECMALKGIGIAPIETDGTGRPRLDLAVETLDLADPEIADAVVSCSGELGTGALDLSTDELLRQVVLAQLTQFSVCMRERGIEDFPDPAPGFTGVGTAYAVAEIPYSNPAFAEVARICSEHLLNGIGSS